MQYLVRVIGGFWWLVAVALTVVLVHEYTSGQNIVTVGVAMLAIGMSSFGLLLARYSWERRAAPEILLGMAIWLAGAVYLTTTELGYWASTYDQRYADYQHGKKAEARRDGMVDRDWKALTTGQVPVSSAQIEAEIDAKKIDPVYDRARQCTEITKSDSRKLCGEVLALRSQLAAARQREGMEAKFVTSAPAVAAAPAMNVFANAEMFARRFGGDERDWADFITITGWLVLMLVRDAGLLVANPLGRRQDRATASKPQEGGDIAATPVPAVLDRYTAYDPQSGMWTHIKRTDLERKPPLNSPEISDGSPPSPPGTSAPPPRAHLEPSVTLERPKPELVAEDGKKLTKGEKKRRAAEKAERAANERIAAVEAFADAMLEVSTLSRGAKGSVRSGGTEGLALRKKFREWAKTSNQWSHLHNVNDSHLGRAFNAVLDAGKDVRGSRYGAVMKQQRRAAA